MDFKSVLGFESHVEYCGHSIKVSTADCGSAHEGSIPSGHIRAGKPSGEGGGL